MTQLASSATPRLTAHSRAKALAATEVLLSTGEDLLIDDYRSNHTEIHRTQRSRLERVMERCGIMCQAQAKWLSFVDRDGAMLVATQALIEVAMAFAKAEPESVHLYLDYQANKLLERYGPCDKDAPARMLNGLPAYTDGEALGGWDAGTQIHA